MSTKETRIRDSLPKDRKAVPIDSERLGLGVAFSRLAMAVVPWDASFSIYPEANVVVAVTSNIAIISSTLRISLVATEMAGFFLAAQPE